MNAVLKPDFEIMPADPVDFPEMAEIGRAWFKLTSFAKDVPYDPQSVLRELERLRAAGMLFVAKDGLDVVGFIGGFTFPMYMNESVLAGMERFFYVAPSYRALGLGSALMGTIENVARKKGCTYWTMISMECMEPEKVGALYRSRDYEKEETSYTKRLK